MEYKISNGVLELTVSDYGAEMTSLVKDGVNYLWTADEKWWGQHAPNLFPYVGRFTEGKYRLHGKEYEMGIHGFAADSVFAVQEQTESSITFVLEDNAATFAQYPCHFRYAVHYRLDGNKVVVGYEVNNTDAEEIYFGLGGHPGFLLPFDEGLAFEDYELTFMGASHPDRIEFTKTCFLTGKAEPYALKDDTSIPLTHELFLDDAVVLQNCCRKVKLHAKNGKRSVTVDYPNLPYIGFWQMVGAPYVCIEPWNTLPSRQDVIEEFSAKSDMVHLAAGENYHNNWSITVE